MNIVTSDNLIVDINNVILISTIYFEWQSMVTFN